MTLAIREVTPSDHQDLLELWQVTWIATYGPTIGDETVSAMLAHLDDAGVAAIIPGQDERAYCAHLSHQLSASLVIAERGSSRSRS